MQGAVFVVDLFFDVCAGASGTNLYEIQDFLFECRLGTNLYEVQAAISREGKPYYADQKMLHWRDEAAFFHVIVKDREYFFGGAFDMQMQARF